MDFQQAWRWAVRCGFSLLLAFPAAAAEGGKAVVLREFVAASPPTPQSHAATIAETSEGLVAAWFGGKHEGDPGVDIWVTRQAGGRWSAPEDVADGRQADGSRQPAWNPVLFQPSRGPLMLFYKIGPAPARWRGMLRVSGDGGRHWSEARALPDGVIGPVKNRPAELAGGDIVSPSSTEKDHWRIHFERSSDRGGTWRIGPPVAHPDGIEAIQPSLLVWDENRLQAIGRTKQDRLFSAWSRDGGRTWSALNLLDVPNPNSGADATMLSDGRALLVYNPKVHGSNWWDGRDALAVAVSAESERWRCGLTLEESPGAELSYPSVLQGRDGLVHIVYTWKRQRIAHVVVDPRAIREPAEARSCR